MQIYFTLDKVQSMLINCFFFLIQYIKLTWNAGHLPLRVLFVLINLEIHKQRVFANSLFTTMTYL